MRGLYRSVAMVLALAAPAAGWGQSEPAAADPAPAPARAPKFEGAIGLVLTSRPAFSGSSDRTLHPQLAGFVRYGRFTLTGSGGLTTRRQDDVARGLDAELVRRGPVRVDLSLRYDPGRRESDSEQLAGMGKIDPTLRVRLGLRWQPVPLWSLSLATSADALGRSGGYFVESGVLRAFPLDARQRIVVSLGLAGAGQRYLQTWYGVDAGQAAASGYPVYTPRAGLRDVSARASWRIEFDPQWAGFALLGAGRLLGSAADSPLNLRRNGVSVSAGLARRF